MAAIVSYEVYSLREGHWNLDSVYDDRSLALDEARSLFQRRYEKGVKVIKEDYDDETNTSIPTTIFHEGEGVKKRRPQVREKKKKPRQRIKTAAPKKEHASGITRYVVTLVLSIGGILLALIALAAFLM